MRSAILFGGIHDGLELELEEGKRTVVLYETHALNPTDLFPIGYYPEVKEDLVTYTYTSERNKEGRWIFQII